MKLFLSLVLVLFASDGLSQKQARQLIRTMWGMSLSTDAVHVRTVRVEESGVAVSAEIETVFRAKQVDGRWRLSEIRTGQDRWEQLELIAYAAGVKLPEDGCGGSSLTVRRARCLVAELLGVTLPSDEVRIKDVSSLELPFGSESSALIEALIRVDFRFVRDNKRWQVSEFKSGNRGWVSVISLSAALDDVKRVRATGDLTAIANALVEFRRERGFFVVSDKESVLIDHLSPRYLGRVIRLDPWLRPYQYDGEQDRFLLRSLGPDGKAGTPDDIVVSGPAQ